MVALFLNLRNYFVRHEVTMVSGRSFPSLPRLASVVTVASRVGGTWSAVRDRARACEASLILDFRSDAELTTSPKVDTLTNIALMNSMKYDRATGLIIPADLQHEIRRPLTMRTRSGAPRLSELFYLRYVDYVMRVQRAFEPGSNMQRYFYGDLHRGIVCIGSANPWWSTERLYVERLLREAWPELRVYHV